MWAFHLPEALKKRLGNIRDQGRSIGFVPTMGALHPGHLSLIERARAEHDFALCSIFVNPTQFNDPADLEKYPRTEAEDFFMLAQAGCDAVFLPPVSAVYPGGLGVGPAFTLGNLDKIMEGEFRPGHFAGVAQVVHRLLELTAPDALYMGQKDFQQTAIVREMIRQAGLPVSLVVCPTLREANGLAMSSRNMRLKPAERERAGVIYQVLQEMSQGGSPPEREAEAFAKLAAVPGFRPEYVRIVDGHTLQALASLDDSDYILACVACWVGEVRLIDNETLKDSTF